MRKGKGQLTYKQEKDYLKKELALARAEAKKYKELSEKLQKELDERNEVK
nr:MAG TPA: TM1b(1-19)Zip, N terminus, protein complex [Caudoviricetes sp.]